MSKGFNFKCQEFNAPFSNQVISTQNLWENTTKSAWKQKCNNNNYTQQKFTAMATPHTCQCTCVCMYIINHTWQHNNRQQWTNSCYIFQIHFSFIHVSFAAIHIQNKYIKFAQSLSPNTAKNQNSFFDMQIQNMVNLWQFKSDCCKK